MENKFKQYGVTLCKKFSKVLINSHITAYSKNNDSLYIRFGNLEDPYNGIRISDHQGKLSTRYSLRADIKQSEKLVYGGKKYFIYSMNDANGMLRRIMKEQPNTVKSFN